MSEIIKPVMLDETGHNIVTALERQNLLISELISDEKHATPVETLREIHRIVQAGEAPTTFSYGDQINLNYNDGTKDYVLPWDIVAFGSFELEDGETKPGMIIQSHYAMQAVQFDASEAIYVAETALPPGTYNFTIGTNWGTHCVSGKTYQFTTTVNIPVGGQIFVGRENQYYVWGAPDQDPTTWKVHTYESNASVAPLESNIAVIEGSAGTALGSIASITKYSESGVNNLQRAAYGYNRWAHSANRKFYNSEAEAGAWWAPSNPFDRPPEQLATVRGFKAGFDAEFLNIIKPVKITTALNTVSDNNIGEREDTYDTFFLPSLEQEYIAPQASGVEGVYFPYWKERLGLAVPQAQGVAGANARHIRYAYNAQTSAQYCRLRSAYRGYASNAWCVYATGYAGSGYIAAGALRGCPACVII